MRVKYQVVLLALFACSLLMVPSSALADPNLGLQLSSSPDTSTLCDNNVNFAGCTSNATDLSPVTGQIVFLGNVGVWHANVTTGEGPPMLTLPDLLDLNNITMTTTGGAPLRMLLTVTGLTTPLGNVGWLNSVGGTNSFAGTTLTINTWLSAANTAFCTNAGCGTLITSQSLSGTAFSGSATGKSTNMSSPYSVTMELTLDSMGHADSTSFDSDFSIPEPATLSVLGAGLLAFGTGLRRKLSRG